MLQSLSIHLPPTENLPIVNEWILEMEIKMMEVKFLKALH